MAKKKNAGSRSSGTAAEAAPAAAEQTAEAPESEVQTEPAIETVSGEELEKLRSEYAALKDQYQRLAAEFDNFRKRTEKEKVATFDNAVSTIIEAFLPVADNFALALSSCDDAGEEFRKGLEMIRKQLDNAFKQLNVEEFGARGEEFDPMLHNAISRIEDPELEEGFIASVYQKGFRIGDKIIRHATVQVTGGV